MTTNEIQNQISNLKKLARQWQASQFRSSQMRDARGVFRAERELTKLWNQIDDLTAQMESTGEVLGYTLPLEVLLAGSK